ncbi:MAG TPA: serine hydrolase [Bacillota bacterium]|nr:serine hydrolase [Bacillota bacterium]
MKNKKIYRRIYNLLLIALLGITLLIIALLSQSAFAKSQTPQLGEDYLQQYFNGSVLVAKGGKILLRKGYGFADFEKGIPNTPTTVFRLGSVTKQGGTNLSCYR